MSDTDEVKQEKVVPAVTKPNRVRKKKRKNKPKDFPKRPLSAYNIFFKEMREEIVSMKKENKEGGADLPSMVKEVANRWKTLPAKERERVETLAKKELVRYKEEVTEYEEKMVEQNRKERLENRENELKKQKVAAAMFENGGRHASERKPAPSGLTLNGSSRALLGEADNLQSLLSRELEALRIIRESRLRQLQIVQEMGDPQQAHAHLENLELQRRVVGLPPLCGGALEPSAASRFGDATASWGGLSSLSSTREEALIRMMARQQQEQDYLAYGHGLSQLGRSALDGIGGADTFRGLTDLSDLRGGGLFPSTAASHHAFSRD